MTLALKPRDMSAVEPDGNLYGILASNTGRYDRQSPNLSAQLHRSSRPLTNSAELNHPPYQ